MKQINLEGTTFNWLGISFHKGKNGVEKADNILAIKLCEYAASKGHDIAKLNCASLYLFGRLGEHNLDKALEYCLAAKENDEYRSRILTKIYLRKKNYDAAKSVFNNYEPVNQVDYIDLLIKLCSELLNDNTWQYACNIKTKLTIESVNAQQKVKIIEILNKLEEKISLLKDNLTKLKKVIQQIVHIASKFSHINDEDIKTVSARILNPSDKNLYKLFIDSLYEEMAQKSRSNENLQNSIQQNSTQTLGGAKYLNELIQNACDAAISERLEVNFILTDEYLVFSHNGKSFTLRDINGLCSYATSDRDKAERDGTIGEKGIGFKSVFNISDHVTVMFGVDKSGFSFNRTHSKWQYEPDNYPWQIIPIWADGEEVKNIFPDGFNEKEVIFIFKIKNAEIRNEIITHLDVLMSDNSILLFLNKLSVIRFIDKQANTEIVLHKELSDDQQICKIKKNNVTDSQWLLFKHTYTLAEEEQKVLATKHDIAMKYRQRKSAFIQFAALTDINAIEKSRGQNKLFCYFSTEVKFQFPFLVSAPFLLNSERAQLLDSMGAKYWNALLVAEIAYAQFAWFQQLAKTEQFWQHPLALIAEPSQIAFPDRASHAKTLFEEKYKKTLEKTKFLRALSGDTLISVNSKMDIHNFIIKFGDELIKQNCISSEYIKDYRNKLKKLGVTEFDAESIKQQLTEEEFVKKLVELEVNRQVCEFFYNLNNGAVNTAIKSVAFILSQNNELKKPADVCEPSDRLRYAIKGFDIKLSLLHPLIESFFRSSEQEKQKIKERQTWLRKLGVKKISVKEIVDAVNAAKSRKITIQFLLSVSQRFLPCNNETKKAAEKREKEFEALKELTLITLAAKNKKISTPIERFYLADDFYPVVPLQKKLPKLRVYLSASEFGKDLNPELLAQYKTLLQKLGVSESITSENIGHLWDSMIDNNHQFIFTKLLFKIFYSSGELEKISQFSELAKILKSKIIFKTTLGKYVGANQCYLADMYQPEFSIQQYANGVDFITEEYIDNQDDQDDQENILRWHQFLIELGVRKDIRISKSEKIYYFDNVYFSYLWGYQGYTAQGKLSGDMDDNELCPPATKNQRFLHQHKVNHYFEIDFIGKIITTPIFLASCC